MPDNDLGRAHGEIKIDSDVDVAKAIAALQALKGRVDSLGDKFDRVGKKAERFQRGIDSLGRRVKPVSKGLAGLAAGIGAVGVQAGKSTAKLTQLDSTLEQIKKTAGSTYMAFAELQSAFSSVGGFAGAAGKALGGLNKELASFPQWMQDFVKMSAAIGGTSAALRTLGKRAGSLGALRSLRSGVIALTTATGVYAGILKNSDNALAGFVRRMYEKSEAAQRLAGKIRVVGDETGRWGSALRRMTPDVDQFLRGTTKMIFGMAAMRKGFTGLMNMSKWFIAAFAGLSVVSGSMSALSTSILGLANAIGQLSGAALLLPGIYATGATAMGVLVPAIKGVSAAFTAGWQDAEKLDEALESLPEVMRPIAKEVNRLKPQIEALNQTLLSNFWEGFGQNIREVGAAYMPILEQGVIKVSRAFASTRESLASFLLEAQTRQDIGGLFNNTARTIHNLGNALRPLLEGLRDLGMVGSQYLSQVTGGAQAAAERFRDWSARSRETGKTMEWITRAVQGLRDLRTIVQNTVTGLGKFFQLFSKSDPSDALSKTADVMERFDAAMARALRGEGKLASFAQRIQQMANTSKEVFDTLVDNISDVAKAAKGMGEEFYDAFGGTLKQSITIIGNIAEALAKLINAVPGLSSLVGTVTALATAAKGMQFAMKPFMRLGEFLGGAGTFAKGAQDSILSLGASFEKVQHSGSRFVAQGGRVQAAFGRMSTGALRLASMMTGPVVAGIMLAIAAIAGMYSSLKEADEAQRRIDASNKKMADSFKVVAQEAAKSGAGIESTFGQAVENSIDSINSKLETVANSDPNKGFGRVMTGFSNLKQELFEDKHKGEKGGLAGLHFAAEDAKKAQKAFEETGITIAQVKDALQANDDSAYESIFGALEEAGGAAFVDEMGKVRAAIQAARDAAALAPPGFVALGEAMDVLRDKASSVSDKMKAIDDALRAMGILKTDKIENFRLLGEALEELGNKAQGLSRVDASGEDIFLSNGELNYKSKTIQSLATSMDSLRARLQTAALNGDDVNEVFRSMGPYLSQLQQQLRMSDAEFQKFITQFGLVPDTISTLVSIEGLSKSEADLLRVSMYLDQMPKNTELTFNINDRDAIEKLKQIKGLTVTENQRDGQTYAITVKVTDPSVVAGQIDDILAQLKKANPKLDIPTRLKDLPPEEQKRIRDQIAKGEPITFPTKTQDVPKPPPGQAPPPQQGQQPPPAQPQQPPQKQQQAPPSPPPEKKPDAQPAQQPPPAQKETRNKETFEVEVKGTDAAIGAVNAVRAALKAAKADGNTSLNLEVKGTDAAIGAVSAVRDAINAMKANVGNVSMNVELRGTDSAIGAANAVVVAVQNMANQIIASVQRAGAAVDQFVGRVRSISTTFNSVAAQATASGASLGQNFANGIASKESAVREAALKLARAASDPLPRSPAKIGPFSGRGWTPFRGQSLALGFAQGISKGAPVVQGETLDMVTGISNALDQMKKVFRLNLAPTSFDANRKPGASGAMFYRDPEMTDEELRKRREEGAKAQKEKTELSAYKEVLKLPELIEKRDKAVQTLGIRAEALNKAKSSGDAERIRKAQESFNKAQESIDNYNRRIEHARSGKSSLEYGSGQASSNLTSFVHSLDDAQYGMGQFNRSMIDCSGFVSAVANEATGREAFSERTDTTRMREFLLARGFKEGMGGAGDLRVGWWDNGGGPNGHTALTLPDGTRAESTTGGVRYGPGAAGHDSAQMTNHMYLPGSAAKSLGDISRNTGEMSDDTKKELSLARKNNKSLDNALNVLSNPRASDFEIIRALQDVSDARTKASPLLKQEYDKRMEAVMEDRGIKKYDPKEGAYKTDQEKVQAGIKAVQSVLSLHDTIVNGISNARETLSLLVRGLENTDSVNQLIDGVQSMVESVTSIIETIAQIAEIAVKAAGSAAAAIPGIGPVIAAVAQIIDIAGIVQSVVDTAQQAFKIGMRYIGKALSWILGGANGPLEGKVRTLLDTNDQTLKSWSQDNPNDKRSMNYDPFNVIADKETSGNGINNLNVYANPDAPADEIINEAMYAVRSSGTGAYND